MRNKKKLPYRKRQWGKRYANSKGFISEIIIFIILILVFGASLLLASGPSMYSEFSKSDMALRTGYAPSPRILPGGAFPAQTANTNGGAGGNSPTKPPTMQLNTFNIVPLSPTPILTLCAGGILDNVLLIDRSGTMSENLPQVKLAANAFVSGVSRNTANRIGITTFNAQATTDVPLTNDFATVRSTINSITDSIHSCLQCAIKNATEEISTNKRDNSKSYMILITDGQADHVEGAGTSPLAAGQAAMAEASNAKTINNTTIFTIGYGTTVNTQLLQEISARTSGFYQRATNSDSLIVAMDNVAQNICR